MRIWITKMLYPAAVAPATMLNCRALCSQVKCPGVFNIS